MEYKKNGFIVGIFSLFCLLPGRVSAQEGTPPPPKNPLSALAKKLAKPPSKTVAAKASVAPSLFKKGKTRLTFNELADLFSDGDKDARKAVLAIMTEGTKAFEEEAKKEKPGAESDVAVAMAFFMTSLHQIASGKDVPDEANSALIAQLHGLFDSPELKSASDEDKQKFWEYCVGTAMFCVGMHEASEERETKEAYQRLARGLFATLLPLQVENVQFTKDGMKVVGEKLRGEDGESKPSTTAPAVPVGKLAVTYDTPKGWKTEKKDGITVLSSPEENLDFRISILSFQPRNGQDIYSFYKEVWAGLIKQYPEEGYVPTPAILDMDNDILMAFDGTELTRTQSTPEVFLTVYEAGDYYLPVVAFWKKEGINFNLRDDRLGLPLTKFMTSVKITGASGHKSPIIQKSQVLGTWENLTTVSLGSYYNTATGAYAGDASSGGSSTMVLNPNGTYEFSAQIVFNGKLRPELSVSHKGNWVLDKHILILTPTSAAKPAQMKTRKFYVLGPSRSQDGKEQRLMLSSFDETLHLSQAIVYLFNYGTANSMYSYKKVK